MVYLICFIRITSDNVGKIWSDAQVTSNEYLQLACKQIIIDNFETLTAKLPQIQQITLELLCEIVQHADLGVSNEEAVFKAIAVWSEANEEKLSENDFFKLFSQIRLTQIAPSYLKHVIRQHRLVCANIVCGLVKNVIFTFFAI